jgi:cbb3-type cytochrome oxidase maturation protein
VNSLVLLIPLSIVIFVASCVALFWAIDDGQFEDTEAAALLPLLDAEAEPPKDEP